MPAIKLDTTYVEKPWGRHDIPSRFGGGGGRKIGEVWFVGPPGRHPPMLVKYLFTSEKLSIQVHPGDAEAKARGLPGGKSECWYVLAAEPGATLGMGTRRPLDAETLRREAQDGSIEQSMDWKPVRAGDFFYIPSGTVHAIGPGLTLVEVQQNNDVTYRLYDYGRPRELHLEDGVAVSKAVPYADAERNFPPGRDAVLLPEGEAPFSLTLHAWSAGQLAALPQRQSWFVPISGEGTIDGAAWTGGECWLVEQGASVRCSASTQALVATLPG